MAVLVRFAKSSHFSVTLTEFRPNGLSSRLIRNVQLGYFGRLRQQFRPHFFVKKVYIRHFVKGLDGFLVRANTFGQTWRDSECQDFCDSLIKGANW